MENEPGREKAAGIAAEVFRFDAYEVNVSTREVRKHGYRVRLSGQPLDVLLLLLERPGELVSRDEIRQRLWPADIFVDFERSLNSAVKKLRGALEDNPHEPRYIETQARKGYRFIGRVERVGVISPSASEAVPQSRAEGQEAAAEPFPTAGSTPPVRKWIGLAVGAAVVVVLLALPRWLVTRHEPTSSSAPAAAVVVRPSVAVLGFQNLSPRNDVGWLSTAFTQMLTTELAAGEHLRTISGENITRAKRDLGVDEKDGYSRETLRALRGDLGSDFVVVGSYIVVGRKGATQIRLDVRLQDTNSGETLSSIAVSGSESEIFDLVARAGEQLRDKLGAKMPFTPVLAELHSALPTNPEAVRLYSEGLTRLHVSENTAARDLLAKAVLAQPDFALAHSALAQAWSALGYDAQALASAQKAVALSKTLPEDRRLEIEGRYFEMKHDWAGAIGVYQHLWKDHPDDLEGGLRLAQAQNAAEDTKAALAVVDALRRLPAPQPDDPRIDLIEAAIAATESDYKRQLHLAQQAAAKAQASGARLLLARAKLVQGWALDDQSQLQEALDAYRGAQQIFASAGDRDGMATALNDVGIVLQKQGDLAGARQNLEEAQAGFRHVGNENGFAGALTNLGEVYRVRGDLKMAESLYRQAIDIFRKIGRKDNEHAAMNNLGAVLYQFGDFPGAHKTFETVLNEKQGTADKDGIAYAQNNLADVLRAQGELEKAKALYEQGLGTFQQIGDRATSAAVQLNLAKTLLLQGDLAAARTKAEEALAANLAVGTKGDAAMDRVVLARIAFEQGDPSQFNDSVRAAMDELRVEHRNDDVVEAAAMEAHALLAQGKVEKAWASIQRARPLPSSDFLAKFHLRVATAQVEAARGYSNRARQQLSAVLTDSTRMGCVSCQFEARLALSKLSRNSTTGVHATAQLVQDARSAGFGLIAMQAGRF